MRDRLLLGPVLIAVLVAGLALDQWIDHRPIAAWLGSLGKTFAGSDGTYPPGVILFFVMFATSLLATRELSAILEDKGIEASKRMMTLAATLGLIVSCLIPSDFGAVDAAAIVNAAAVIVLVTSLLFYSRHKGVKGVISATAGSLFAFVYLGLTFGFLLAIRREHSAWMLLWVLMVTKSSDIGAYFTGVALGRHKLIPWLSPGKTWEGLIGGIVLSSLVAWLGLRAIIGWTMPGASHPPIWVPISAGVIFAIIGQAGDLTASLLKRDAGIKDSGRVVPGFGGVIDLIDSPLLIGPVAFAWLRIVEGMGVLPVL